MAPYTEKIHTQITLGICNRSKPLVLKARKRRQCGFDSHRPLRSQATPGQAGLQDWGQDVDPMGKSWELMLGGDGLMALTYPRSAPRFTRTVTRGNSQKINCVISTLPSWRERSRVAGLDPNLPVASGRYRASQLSIRFLTRGRIPLGCPFRRCELPETRSQATSRTALPIPIHTTWV